MANHVQCEVAAGRPRVAGDAPRGVLVRPRQTGTKHLTVWLYAMIVSSSGGQTRPTSIVACPAPRKQGALKAHPNGAWSPRANGE